MPPHDDFANNKVVFSDTIDGFSSPQFLWKVSLLSLLTFSNSLKIHPISKYYMNIRISYYYDNENMENEIMKYTPKKCNVVNGHAFAGN